MNPYMAGFRRWSERSRPHRRIENRIYVFILVPLDIYGNGHVRKATSVDAILDALRTNGREATTTRINENSPIANGGNESSESQFDYRLAWTRFLPNPLWPPKDYE